MVKVILEPAENGIIKRIVDDNYGGSKEQVSSTNVYELDGENIENTIEFLYELCEDLGIYTGSKFSKRNLDMLISWGSHYEPSDDEIDKKIQEFQAEIELLKVCKKG